MPLPPTVELVCSFSTIKTEPLSPFVWLLMKTLSEFSPGCRPEFQALAEKMAFNDAQYLNLAWEEAKQFKLCVSGKPEVKPAIRYTAYDRLRGDAIDFETAKLTEHGVMALRDGFIRTGEVRKRSEEAVYFLLRDGVHVEWKSYFEPKYVGSLQRPKWAGEISVDKVAKALASQRESSDERIEPDEQIFDLTIDWDASRRVKLD